MSGYSKTFFISGLCFLILTFSFLFFSQASAARAVPSQLVPCGSSAAGQQACTVCHLWVLASNIINFIFYGLAIPVLTIMLIWGGILMLGSFGNPSQITKGKKAMTSALVGILITASSYLIVSTLINTFASGKFTAGWATIDCKDSTGGGGGVTTPTPTPAVPGVPTPTPASTALQCSALNISPQTDAMVKCVLAQDAADPDPNFRVNQPASNQLNGGTHACNLTASPPSISCHYGGRLCNGSGNAADFTLAGTVNGTNWNKLLNLAINCSPAGGGARCERGSVSVNCVTGNPDHVHANASAGCGCQ